MKKNNFLLLCMLTFPLISFSDESPKNIPQQLFGITLGNVYDIGTLKNNDFGNMPVSKATGANRFLGQGVHYYFQPKKEYKAFPYLEVDKKEKDEFYKTSFRLYLLPVISSSIKDNEELKNTKMMWEVSLIEWQDNRKSENKDDTYYWAMDLCKTFKYDLDKNPVINDSFQEKTYICEFKEDNRILKISNSLDQKTIQLLHTKEYSDIKNEEIERKIHKLRAKEISPYK